MAWDKACKIHCNPLHFFHLVSRSSWLRINQSRYIFAKEPWALSTDSKDQGCVCSFWVLHLQSRLKLPDGVTPRTLAGIHLPIEFASWEALAISSFSRLELVWCRKTLKTCPKHAQNYLWCELASGWRIIKLFSCAPQASAYVTLYCTCIESHWSTQPQLKNVWKPSLTGTHASRSSSVQEGKIPSISLSRIGLGDQHLGLSVGHPWTSWLIITSLIILI